MRRRRRRETPDREFPKRAATDTQLARNTRHASLTPTLHKHTWFLAGWIAVSMVYVVDLYP